MKLHAAWPSGALALFTEQCPFCVHVSMVSIGNDPESPFLVCISVYSIIINQMESSSFFKFLIEVQLIYNAVLISDVTAK